MNDIYPTVATVTSIYTNIITVVADDTVADTVEDTVSDTVSDSICINIADSECIDIIYDDNTDSTISTTVNYHNYGNKYKIYCACIIFTALTSLFIVVGTIVLISI